MTIRAGDVVRLKSPAHLGATPQCYVVGYFHWNDRGDHKEGHECPSDLAMLPVAVVWSDGFEGLRSHSVPVVALELATERKV